MAGRETNQNKVKQQYGVVREILCLSGFCPENMCLVDFSSVLKHSGSSICRRRLKGFFYSINSKMQCSFLNLQETVKPRKLLQNSVLSNSSISTVMKNGFSCR